ncbi:hypothetical protein [Victivallis vadensis]|uniref:hypothetical protein n=1 Tax=Victivallis vadensis TaxID=172901 RepID=UPI003AF629D8
MLIDIKGRWQQFKETLKKVNDAAKESGKKVKESMESAQKGLEAGGISGDKFGKFKELAASFTPMAAAGILVGTAIKLATAAADAYLQKLQDIVSLSKANAAEAERVAAANDKRRASETEAARKLEELNAQEQLSNSQRQEVVSIVESLNRAYDGLGITIDGTTGKVKNLDESLAALAQRQQKTLEADLNRQLKNLQQQRRSLNDIIEADSVGMRIVTQGRSSSEAMAAAQQIQELDNKIRELQLKLHEVSRNIPAKSSSPGGLSEAEIKRKEEQAAAANAAYEKQRQAAEEQAKREQAGRDKIDGQLDDLDARLRKQQLILAGKQRELAITEELEKAEKAARDAGIELTPQQRAEIMEKASNLYNLTNSDKNAARIVESYQPRQISDSLARIGGYNGAQRTEANNQLAYMRKTSNNVETINSNVNRLTAEVTNRKTSTLIAP